MIKVELLTEKPIALQLQEAQHVSLSVSPLAGTVKGRDAYSPYIGEAGTWVCWNDADAQWVDTGVKAVGEKGDPGEPGIPGSDANVTADTIRTALGFAPVGPHTHAYDEITGTPQIPTVPIQEVQVNGTSIVQDGVANVPVAGTDRYGVIKVQKQNGINGVMLDKNNMLVIAAATQSYIDSRSGSRPIVAGELDYTVKAAMCDGKGAEWTEAEKAAAQERMGIDRALIMSLIDDGSEVEY